MTVKEAREALEELQRYAEVSMAMQPDKAEDLSSIILDDLDSLEKWVKGEKTMEAADSGAMAALLKCEKELSIERHKVKLAVEQIMDCPYERSGNDQLSPPLSEEKSRRCETICDSCDRDMELECWSDWLTTEAKEATDESDHTAGS